MKIEVTSLHSAKKHLPSYGLMLPFLVLYIIFTFYPIARGFIVSFQDYHILGTKNFVGFSNYSKIFHDPTLWSSILHTLIFVAATVPLLLIIPFLLAILVNSPLKGRRIYQAVFFSPMILGVSVISSIWGAMLGNYGGLVDSVLNFIGIHQQINWVASSAILAWISVTAITVWWTSGFNMVLYLAALQDIPDDQYEAASLDGAGSWSKLFYITIPGVRRVILVIAFLQIIASFNVFGQVFLLTGGGPAGSTSTLVMYIYNTAFGQYAFGPGAAGAYLLFVILLVISFLQLRLMSRQN